MNVEIRHDALISMIASSFGVFKKEVYGILIGIKDIENCRVNYAFENSTAKRKFIKVDVGQNGLKRLESCLDVLLPDQYQVGDFHSHTQYGNERANPTLKSDEDREYVFNNPNLVSLVLSINEKKLVNEDKVHGRIYSTIKCNGKIYLVELAGYYSDNRKSIKKANLHII